MYQEKDKDMEIRIKIKPFSVIEKQDCLKWAIANEGIIPTTYGSYGVYREDWGRSADDRYAIVYHAEVKKRGKHKGHITTTIRKYRISLELLRLMNCKVVQYPRYFRIISK